MAHPIYLNVISLLGMFGLCAIAWLFSENRRIVPWRIIFWGIGLQLLLGLLVFWFPPTKFALEAFSRLLDGVFVAADVGARFVFGPALIPPIGQAPTPGIGTIFAFRVLPTVVFFAGLMALLYNIGVIQPVVNFFAKLFYAVMRLSGAEALSGAANIFVGIEAAIVVKPFLAKMTRSELCAILACCFGTAASSTLAIYVRALQDVFPNILVHLVSASIIAIPACFVLSKILVPETEIPLTAGGIPQEEKPNKGLKTRPGFDEEKQFADGHEEFATEGAPQETVGGEPIERVSPVDAAIVGAIDGLRMAVTIGAVLILILGLVSLIDQIFAALAGLQNSSYAFLQPVGQVFQVVTLDNILGVMFYPFTLLTGVPYDESWQASILIGSRLLKTAIPPYQQLGQLAAAGALSDRTVLIVSYALSGFAHMASVGIFVGGTIALIPSRRKDISELGWKALFIGTLATLMIGCVAGIFDNGDPSILGRGSQPVPAQTAPAAPATSPLPGAPSVTPAAPVSPAAPAMPGTPPTGATPSPAPAAPESPAASPSPAPGSPAASPSPEASASPAAPPAASPSPTASPSP